jgi:DNA-binding GntR family transcriptional regulator
MGGETAASERSAYMVNDRVIEADGYSFLQVDFHELLYEYTSYGVAKRTYDTAKDERNRIGNQLQEVQNKNKPLENLKT